VRIPAHRLVLIGGLAAVAGFGLLGVRVSPVLVFLSVFLQGVAWVFLHTTLQTWATMLSEEARATAVSLFAGFLFLGNGVGSYLAGVTLESRGSGPLFTVTAVGLAVFTVVATASRRRYAARLG
jgi:predicted MFS family arabinose efflux permease